MRNRKETAFNHSGSSFDSFLEEEGILEEVDAAAIKRVIAWNERIGLSSIEDHAEAGWPTPANLRSLICRLPSQGQDTVLRTAMAASVCGAARCKGPLPHGARVYVDELTFRVVTHATSAK